ncbi:uncharacterized protein EI90DRAFT_3017505 [Cantharellus anzutake]|uniref:uncharacterized protein n=1 Tax=Cantharellus anzutake TaxID=1750568 RepID=UPI00190788E8|nr:uncharacterized protein EI90DRAFT_3017505 [Cantharellus anzutake]KAF8328912.1 hypothetical protein EI90DRAFT_3017505 [Cantharellus anzutake]
MGDGIARRKWPSGSQCGFDNMVGWTAASAVELPSVDVEGSIQYALSDVGELAQDWDVLSNETDFLARFGHRVEKLAGPATEWWELTLRIPLRHSFQSHYLDLTLKFRNFLRTNYGLHNIDGSEANWVIPRHYYKIRYQPFDDGSWGEEFVRTNKIFHGHHRDDAIMMRDVSGGMTFARVHALLEIAVGSSQCLIALVSDLQMVLLSEYTAQD